MTRRNWIIACILLMGGGMVVACARRALRGPPDQIQVRRAGNKLLIMPDALREEIESRYSVGWHTDEWTVLMFEHRATVFHRAVGALGLEDWLGEVGFEYVPATSTRPRSEVVTLVLRSPHRSAK